MSKSNGARGRTPAIKHRTVSEIATFTGYPRKRLSLVGTAEAAAILGVERPRIGRWKKNGIMPPTVADLQAGPVWHKDDIERMVPYVTSIRRERFTEGPTLPKRKAR